MYNDFISIGVGTGTWTVSTNCISAFEAPQPLVTANPWPPTPKQACKAKQEMENTMRCETVTPKTDAAIQRDYLIERLRDAKYTIRDTIAPAFHIHESSMPKNYKELIEWIKEGKFELDTKRTNIIDALLDNDEYYGYNPFDGIKFTGRPGPDWDGYHAAEKALDKAYTAAKDVIMTGDAAAGLKALQDFEAWTPVGKPN